MTMILLIKVLCAFPISEYPSLVIDDGLLIELDLLESSLSIRTLLLRNDQVPNHEARLFTRLPSPLMVDAPNIPRSEETLDWRGGLISLVLADQWDISCNDELIRGVSGILMTDSLSAGPRGPSITHVWCGI